MTSHKSGGGAPDVKTINYYFKILGSKYHLLKMYLKV